jgi:hypothetical protein
VGQISAEKKFSAEKDGAMSAPTSFPSSATTSASTIYPEQCKSVNLSGTTLAGFAKIQFRLGRCQTEQPLKTSTHALDWMADWRAKDNVST